MTPNQFFEFLNVHTNKLHTIQTTNLNLSVKQYFQQRKPSYKIFKHTTTTTFFFKTSTDFHGLNTIIIKTIFCQMSRNIQSKDTILFMVTTNE